MPPPRVFTLPSWTKTAIKLNKSKKFQNAGYEIPLVVLTYTSNSHGDHLEDRAKHRRHSGTRATVINVYDAHIDIVEQINLAHDRIYLPDCPVMAALVPPTKLRNLFDTFYVRPNLPINEHKTACVLVAHTNKETDSNPDVRQKGIFIQRFSLILFSFRNDGTNRPLLHYIPWEDMQDPMASTYLLQRFLVISKNMFSMSNAAFVRGTLPLTSSANECYSYCCAYLKQLDITPDFVQKEVTRIHKQGNPYGVSPYVSPTKKVAVRGRGRPSRKPAPHGVKKALQKITPSPIVALPRIVTASAASAAQPVTVFWVPDSFRKSGAVPKVKQPAPVKQLPVKRPPQLTTIVGLVPQMGQTSMVRKTTIGHYGAITNPHFGLAL